MNSEVEIKYKVSEFSEIRNKLQRAGSSLLVPESEEINTVFDLPNGRMLTEGRLLRLREFAGSVLLTVKETCIPGAMKQRQEHQSGLTISLAEAERMLEALGYYPVYRYVKKREIWEVDRGVHVCLDTLYFGCFVEFEADTEKKVAQAAESLGFSPETGIAESYRQLELLHSDVPVNDTGDSIS